MGPGFISGHGVSAAQLPSSLGQAVSAASLSVVIASDYTLPVTISTTAGTPMFTELSDGAAGYTGAKTGQFPTSLGRTTMAGSLSVALASDQAALAVNATVQNATLAVTQSGAWTVAQSGTWAVRNQDGTGNALSSTSGALNVSVQNASLAVTAAQLPATLGQKLSASSMSVVIASDQSAVPVSQSGTWTVSSTQLPASLGQTTMAASLPVTLASNQTALPVSQSGTWNVATVTAVTAITNALPAGANVIGGVTQSGTWATRLNDGVGTSVTVGQKAMASALPVVIASDQSAVPVSGTFWQATQPVSVAATVTTTQTGIDYNTGLAGATTQRVTEAGRAKAWLARNDYTSTAVTTGAYVQLVASTGAATTRLRIFDSSGSAMILATGAAASEVDQLYIPPGGWDSPIEFSIAAGTRVSLKALDANAAVGQIVITALS